MNKDIIKAILAVTVDYALSAPRQDALKRINNWVIESYPNINAVRFIKAFDMNATGRYWESIKPFGSMDKSFIGSVLSKFLEYERVKNQRGHNNHQKYLDAPKWTPKDSYDRIIETYKKRGYPKLAPSYGWAYKYATENGIFAHDSTMWSNEMEKARKIIERGYVEGSAVLDLSMMSIITLNDNERQLPKEEQEKLKVEKQAKYMAAKECFQKLHPPINDDGEIRKNKNVSTERV